MPRKFPKPFFRTGRGWYVQLGSKQIKLAYSPENAETQDQAQRAYHQVMVKRGADPTGSSAVSEDQLTVAEVFEKFLDWCEKSRATRTYEWYRAHIQAFCESLPRSKEIESSKLRPYHIIEWVNRHDSWRSNYLRGAITANQRPFNWAEKLGYIDRSPVRYIEKPQPQRREQFVSSAEWIKIRDSYKPGDPTDYAV